MKKIYVSILLFLVPLMGAWVIPENYYYFKDSSQIVYMPKSADSWFSMYNDEVPINISGNTIYGYLGTGVRVTFPVYDNPYYYNGTGVNQQQRFLTFDPDSFETNLNLVTNKKKQIDYGLVITALVGVMVFLNLISFNQFRVRKAREKAI